MMPNTFAYAMLLLWPLVALWLFKKLPRSEALIWTLVAGYLLLPVRASIDFPVLPPLDKSNSPTFAAFAMCLAGVGVVMTGRRHKAAQRARMATAPDAPQAAIQSGWLPAGLISKALVMAVVFGPFVTALLNPDRVNFAYGGFVNGLKPYDAFANVMNHAVLVLPMLLARKYLATEQDQRLILRILVLAGLAYSIPMLIEARLSPQLHTWIYGFFQHSFAQTYRFGGWRPFVFLEHGLRVALFAAIVFLAAIALWRTAPRMNKGRALLTALWLGFMLVMCRSVGALLLAAIIAPVILVFGQRVQLLAAALIAVFVMLYPSVRGSGTVTAPSIMSVVKKVIPSKSGSLGLRLVNEDRLLARASQRPAFGWGGWGRSRVYDAYTGEDISVTDGAWAIIIGEYGWVGYIGTFGLLALPIFGLFRLRGDPGVTLETSALCLILSLNLIDLLPNSGLTLITWMVAGSLIGRAEQISAERSERLNRRSETRGGAAAGARVQRAVSGGRTPAAAPQEDAPAPVPASPARANPPGAAMGLRTGGKAHVAPQQTSRYPSYDDAPPKRRPPPSRTRR